MESQGTSEAFQTKSKAQTPRVKKQLTQEELAARATQKVSPFKLIREIPKDSTNSGVFHKEVEWTILIGTKQTYKKMHTC
jgi:hypothetical protein